MGSLSSGAAFTILISLFSVFLPCKARLSSTFYDRTCPNALATIQNAVRNAISREHRMAGSLIRLYFHDCFVQVGGLSWAVKLGRRDLISANRVQAEADLPLAINNLDQLLANFRRKGLSDRDMVTFSGAHTIGQATCLTFHGRIHSNDTNIDAGFRSTRRLGCPVTGGDGNLAPLDLMTPNSFDNNYFRNLVQRKGLLNSDQVLFNGGSTDVLVTEYSRNRAAFYSNFAAAMIKMGDINPLTSSAGQVRRLCSVPN